MKAEMHALEGRLGDPSIPEAEHETMLSRYSDLQDRFRLHEGYNIELKTGTVLHGLGFETADFERPTETFSGGWQMRLALAKLLLGQPNLLLLDEPTNHLDLEARNWLETYLNEYPHAVILVSHDRFFLDAVVTRIADLTLRTLTDYHTNYSGYLVEHHERIEALRKAKREQDEEVSRVKMFIDRFRYQATKASQVQSRIKALEKIVLIEVPPERATIHFTFPACAKSGRTVLELKHVRKAYGDLARVRRSERPHRARRPHRPGRPQRRRQIDADADALRAKRRPTAASASKATTSSCSTSPRTKRRGWIRRRRCTRRWPPDRRCTWSRRFGTSSAAFSSPATMSTNGCACCRAVSARAWPSPACCCAPRTRSCSTSRPTISISIRRKCCSTRSSPTAAR